MLGHVEYAVAEFGGEWFQGVELDDGGSISEGDQQPGDGVDDSAEFVNVLAQQFMHSYGRDFAGGGLELGLAWLA